MGLPMMGVDCDSIELSLDKVVECLEEYVEPEVEGRARSERERDAIEAIGELRKVILYRGNVLFIRRRVNRTMEYCLSIRREKRAEKKRIEGLDTAKS